jgi:hypothetical protein
MSNNPIIPPAGWPAHLPPYDPGRHRPIDKDGVTFYPLNHTPGQVKSFVAMVGDQHVGIVTADRDKPLQLFLPDGHGLGFPSTLKDAASLLLTTQTHSNVTPRVKVQCLANGQSVRVTRFGSIHRVETEGGEYIGFLDRRISPVTNRPEYRAAGCSKGWRASLNDAVADLF